MLVPVLLYGCKTQTLTQMNENHADSRNEITKNCWIPNVKLKCGINSGQIL
jgi:hypothetical protein